MYIDKIYTKLYSERNWNGLDQLVNEIKQFTRAEYQFLTDREKAHLDSKRRSLMYEISEGGKRKLDAHDIDYIRKTTLRDAVENHNNDVINKAYYNNEIPGDRKLPTIINLTTDKGPYDEYRPTTTKLDPSIGEYYLREKYRGTRD